jgi:predicted component of type VI protein secretion system
MHLRYVNKLGIPKDIELTGEPLSIGRSRDAAIPLLDDKVSRIHCGIRISDGEFYLKDLKSRNGTFVNGQRVEDTVKLKPGDRIQIGSTLFLMESASSREEDAKALGSMQDQMDGKGYSTILKEIVEDIAPHKPAPAPDKPAAPSAPAKTPIKVRPTIKVASAPKEEAPPPSPNREEPASPATRKKIVIKR